MALALTILHSSYAPVALADDEPEFSGPQVGEELPNFQVLGVYDDLAGKELDFVEKADGDPLLLVFVHEVTRPSAAFTRILGDYAHGRADDGLTTLIVWLAADRSEAERYLLRARESLGLTAPVGISPDGQEGPGSYGLNRKMTLTVLVADKGRVTANFALVQPSLTELPDVMKEIVKLIGGEAPTLEEIEASRSGRGRAMREGDEKLDPKLRPLLRAVIRLDATEEEVAEAVQAVEEYVAKERAARRQLRRIARTVSRSEKFDQYVTPPAREAIKRWADEPGPADEKSSDKEGERGSGGEGGTRGHGDAETR